MTTASRQDLIPLLAKHPFFKDLTRDHLTLLAEDSTLKHFAAGEYLGREDQRAHSFYLILKGIVALETGQNANRPIAVQSLSQDEILGWSWFVPPYRWDFDARAVEDVTTLAFDGDRLRLLCESDHELGYQIINRLLQVITGRLVATRRQLVENTRVNI